MRAKTWMFGALAAGAVFLTGATSVMEPMEVLSTPNAHFLSGGVGLKERASLREEGREYNLHVSVARKSDGAYLSYAELKLEGDALSEPVELTAAGPFLLGSIPRGDYTLTVSLAGWNPVRRNFTITGHTPEYIFIALDPSE